MEQQNQQVQFQQYPQNTNIPEEYKPISMWGYFGYEILFSIPCVGLILLLVFAFGGTKNVNLRNFARSYFCFVILLVVLFAVFAMLGGLAAIGSNY
ncbi:MAG: ABC transporter permease [Clostridia bacterium]|nr:ABC transporter permease [Clostridia bacterium]